MNYKSQAKIISYNINNDAVCASAARISTTLGDANEIFEKSKTNSNNETLIKKVLKSGHRSVIEHAVFTIALWNVSAFVEQFFIECRLASFTVKSRRYVDFTNQGYYIPSDLHGDDLSLYCKYMDLLFDGYQKMLKYNIPKEDARFLLPYSFNSNFYCTINARELVSLIGAIKKGRGKNIPELQGLANQIIEQIKSIFPCILDDLNCISDMPDNNDSNNQVNKNNSPVLISENEAGIVKMINSPHNPEQILETAYSINNPYSLKPHIDYEELINAIRPRDLEQLTYSFVISNISLSGITHMVRHRMQSIIIPSIQSIDYNKYIIPNTVCENCDAKEIYLNVINNANEIIKAIGDNAELNKYLYYFALSGNVMDIMTTMNARELLLFTRLRACNRAQWEVREISIQMLKQLRAHFPELFNKYGPSCYVYGKCPEGQMTCGKMKEVFDEFSRDLEGTR